MILLSFLSAAALANPDYEAGVAALKARDNPGAIAAFGRCVAAEPPGSPEATACRWELGWAYWNQGNWPQVVAQWEPVAAVDPTRQGLREYLAAARDNAAVKALLDKGRDPALKPHANTAPKNAKVRLRAVGDLMIGSAFPEGVLPPDDGVGTFDDVGPWLRDADLTFGNLEGPLCDEGVSDKCSPDKPPGSCYAFRSPTRYGAYYKAAGFDVMSTANNHASDFGPECRATTEATLQSLGIAHSGRPGDVASLSVNGLKIALIAFHTNRNSHYVNDTDEAKALVRAMTADHDLVIVSFHGGAEGGKAQHVPVGGEQFYGEDRGDLRVFTHAVIDAGADLVIGHGPHVLRGAELYKDRLIAYSLGNFATYGRFSLGGPQGIGAVLDVTLDREGRFVSGKILPTAQVDKGRPIRDPNNAAIDLLRELSEADFPTTAVRVGPDGSLGRR